MLNPKSRAIEFWLDEKTDQVMAAYKGNITKFKDADIDVGTRLMAHICEKQKFEDLYEAGYNDPIELMEEYIRRNFAGFDNKPDLTLHGSNLEITGHPDSLNNPKLTARELEYISLSVQDLPDKQIAEKMGCSHHTINQHRRACQLKTKTHSKAGLVAWAFREGLC
jgi:DNA-binding CsgD family transcriptional regulator